MIDAIFPLVGEQRDYSDDGNGNGDGGGGGGREAPLHRPLLYFIVQDPSRCRTWPRVKRIVRASTPAAPSPPPSPPHLPSRQDTMSFRPEEHVGKALTVLNSTRC